MGPLDAIWHLLNFAGPALGVGALSAAAAKLLWRRELEGVSWWRLAGFGVGGGLVALLGGLAVFGRDGTMATYGTLVLLSAVALWWAGFGPGRR
jgi:hypothetical protein